MAALSGAGLEPGRRRTPSSEDGRPRREPATTSPPTWRAARRYGFSSDRQWNCLNLLWEGESAWDYTAENPSSGAYGIPQSLPGSKMADVAPDWRTNAETQITWGLAYIAARYGNPQGAWEHSERVGWY